MLVAVPRCPPNLGQHYCGISLAFIIPLFTVISTEHELSDDLVSRSPCLGV